MTLPQKVQDAVKAADDAAKLAPNDSEGVAQWTTIRAELHRLTEIAEGATAKVEAANALLLRYCVQVGELTKGLDPHDPIFSDIQKLGADYMAHHLQGAGDEA